MSVYQNRQRVRRDYGKSLLRRRGELVERTFAHCYETGGMRRRTLYGRKNILKRLLIHVGAFNISLVLRKMLGSGKPRELKNRAAVSLRALSSFSPTYAGTETKINPFLAPLNLLAIEAVPSHSGSCRSGKWLLKPQAARPSRAVALYSQ